jgi:hypothetical protein
MTWLKSYLFCRKCSISKTTVGWKVAETWMLGVLVIQLWHSACCNTLYRSHTIRCRYILQECERKYIYNQHSHSISCHAAARRVVSYTRLLFGSYIDNLLKIHCPKFMHRFIHYLFALWWIILDILWVERMAKWKCTYLILMHLRMVRVPSLTQVICKEVTLFSRLWWRFKLYWICVV